MRKILAFIFVAMISITVGHQSVSAQTGYGGDGNSSGRSSSSSRRAIAPQGQVLGAATTATTTVPVCTQYLSTFMRIDKPNDVEEVKKLQVFLGEELGKSMQITKLFDTQTDSAVREFQMKYKDDVLVPWGIAESTGYVYKTTQRKINLLRCPQLVIPIPNPLVNAATIPKPLVRS